MSCWRGGKMRKHLIYPGIVIGLIVLFLLMIYLTIERKEEHTYKSLAERMIAEQIEARGVKDKKVLQAMRVVPATSSSPKASKNTPMRIGLCP